MHVDSHDTEFFAGLKALAESAFPKRCKNCGKVYDTAQDFIEQTQTVRQGITGLKQSVDDDEMAIVEAYRNCGCGSTLMDVFSNRRDASEAGQRRREHFDKLIPHLVSKGMSRAEARDYLIRVLRGDAPHQD